MKKAKNKEWLNTSFHGVTILASVNQIKEVCGEPSFRNPSAGVAPDYEKTTVEWHMLTQEVSEQPAPRPAMIFTIYDWKEYREFSDDEVVEFHIGAECEWSAGLAEDELKHRLEFPDEEYVPPM